MKRLTKSVGFLMIIGSSFFVTPAIAQNDTSARTEQASDDDDGDEGKWGLAGLLGLLGLLGLKRRDDDNIRERRRVD